MIAGPHDVSSKIVRAGAIFGCLSVVIGAFGAHALKATLAANQMQQVYETGVQYHAIHALAMIACGILLALRPDSRKFRTAAILFGTGIVLFSGSLYVLAVTNTKLLGIITPLGGVCFIAGWIYMVLAA
jgi:uncharacterized membrane protein YgdD (TMEM256/DUF423 family)